MNSITERIFEFYESKKALQERLFGKLTEEQEELLLYSVTKDYYMMEKSKEDYYANSIK